MPSIDLERTRVTGCTGPLHLLIIDSSLLRRACMAIALETTGLKVTSVSSLGEQSLAYVADMVLFQVGDSPEEAAVLPRAIAHVARLWPRAPVIVIADHGDEQMMLAAVAAGAQGVLRSTISVPSIQQALNLVSEGLSVYPGSVAGLIQRRLKFQASSGDELQGRIRTALDQLAPLTRRQRDVLELLAQGASNKDIANRLRISESTVKVHVRAIMALNGASNRTQIVAHLLKGDDPGH